ncbi:hypothetical protein [Streptomyces sp. NPDC005385]|uniref:hypothetical protein n=1 Tax=Streptomyces sp. NPDC005385 TaxID=3157039 RepID=UPI0033B2892D
MTDLPTILASTAGVCVSLGAIFYSIRRSLRFIQKASNGFDAITALSEEIKPGEFTTFKDHVMHELSPNSGGSIKDHITATNRLITEHVNNAALHSTGPQIQIQNLPQNPDNH